VFAPGKLIIWRPFKPIFFKNVFNIYLVVPGETDIPSAFTFRQLCEGLPVETEPTGTIFPVYSSHIKRLL
jgi:hypothetical protein